ncbi:MAG: 50S ribosomal protein L29 [Acidobacteria bacterium]|jgi:large subunit ribosomal protein L29|nr:MAG: 50S ribosomal protein L29 [Acidobacteriota bacterium]
MKAEKIRDLSDEELRNQERDFSEQVFRLRFQMATGQTEGLSKLRSLKKDIARLKTIRRERQIKSDSAAKK